MQKISSLLLALFIICGSTKVVAQVQLTKIDEPIILDGIIDEDVWETVEVLTPVQYEPIFMGEMSETSVFRVAYDENFIYVAGELHTEDHESIVKNSLTRDQYSNDDVFAIVLDPFNDNENGLWFFTTPAGVRVDIALSNDANFGGGSNAMNSSWNTFWDVATTQDENGWYAEMRIPFSSIGFQSNNGVAEMGMIVYRWIASANERHIYPAIPPNWNMGNAKPSQAQDVLLEGVKSKQPLYFTPYAIAGQNGVSDLNELETDYETETDFQREVGFDMKYNLNSNLTLDVTVNTDFAQVEADDQQLNLSRFSLFFPEKRQFFQERAGLFDVAYGRNRLFYSRKIGLDDEGNPVRILGGARVTGRMGDWDLGVINMQTADSDSLPTENFGVLRLQRKTINELSNVGALFTSRVGGNGDYNFVYGFDSETNLFGDLFLEMMGSQTIDSQSPEEQNLENTTALRLALTLQKSIGFNYRLVVNRTGEEYDPGIGFVRRTGNSDYFTRFAYGWFAPDNSIVNRYNADFVIYTQSANNTYDLLGRSIWGGFDVRFKQYGRINMNLRYNNEILMDDEDFNLLSSIHVPSGEYKTYEIGIDYQTNEGRKVQAGFGFEYGGLYDGISYGFNFEPKWNVSPNLELGGNYGVTFLEFPEFENRNITVTPANRDDIATGNEYAAHLGQLRAQYAFNKRASLSTFVQYSNVAELVGANLRFRYNFSEGRDFWIVFNEQINTMRDQLDAPRMPLTQARTILVKYSHTFVF
ncbi:MAG: carbohydrate binding family 9 domain-containing protein [Balneolaceae bacterium]|nr:carbohydrate binding family 9 domain-containing protein [Balneolaceae bacterium]